MLEALAPTTQGVAFIEVADRYERLEIANRTAIALHWIYRDGVDAGADPRLADAIMSVEWPVALSCFGWFAAEAKAAGSVRRCWREERGLGRDTTLTATYWSDGADGFMAGG